MKGNQEMDIKESADLLDNISEDPQPYQATREDLERMLRQRTLEFKHFQTRNLVVASQKLQEMRDLEKRIAQMDRGSNQ
jgi:hypothetical protein